MKKNLKLLMIAFLDSTSTGSIKEEVLFSKSEQKIVIKLETVNNKIIEDTKKIVIIDIKIQQQI